MCAYVTKLGSKKFTPFYVVINSPRRISLGRRLRPGRSCWFWLMIYHLVSKFCRFFANLIKEFLVLFLVEIRISSKLSPLPNCRLELALLRLTFGGEIKAWRVSLWNLLFVPLCENQSMVISSAWVISDERRKMIQLLPRSLHT